MKVPIGSVLRLHCCSVCEMLALSFLLCLNISAPAVFFCTALHKVWIFMGSIYIDMSYHHHLFVFYVGCSSGSTLAHQFF